MSSGELIGFLLGGGERAAFFREISDGMRPRVGIARALVSERTISIIHSLFAKEGF